MRNKTITIIFTFLFILFPQTAYALSPGPEVHCCWHLTDVDHGGGIENACDMVDNSENLDCERVLASWERTQEEWISEQEDFVSSDTEEDDNALVVLALLSTLFLVLAIVLFIKVYKNKQQIGGANKLHKCKECGLSYESRDLKKECEKWCKKHKTCNLDIIKHAVENRK